MQFKIILIAIFVIPHSVFAMAEPEVQLDWQKLVGPEFDRYSIESHSYDYPQDKLEENPRKAVSLLDACILGTVVAHGKFVEFADYADNDVTYFDTHENFTKLVATVYTKMQWLLYNGWQPDCKKDLQKILELSAGFSFEQKKKTALRRFKHLTECDKLQMISYDFYRFMANRDGISDAGILVNRMHYKKNMIFYNSQLFNQARSRPLHGQQMLPFSQSIQECIKKIHAATEKDVLRSNDKCTIV